jgi:hypothetical protein
VKRKTEPRLQALETVQGLALIFVVANCCVCLSASAAPRFGGGRPGGGGGFSQRPMAIRAPQQVRSQQEEAVRGREEQARAMQQQGIRQQQQREQEQMRQMQRQEQAEQRQQQNMAEEQRREQQRQQENVADQQRRVQERFNLQERQSQQAARSQQFSIEPGRNVKPLQRQFNARPFSGARAPVERAMAMPALHPGANERETAHFNQVRNNLKRHLVALPQNQLPRNWTGLQNQVLSNYANNYQFRLNNQLLRINRANTFFNPVPEFEYPSWWQPTPGWVFSNGFTLGNVLNVGLDWLRWGWHPYYGPPPDGFVCASNYIPTPWIYVPAYGLWRLAGSNAWAPSGPPFNYEGPITVEVLEPRNVSVVDPYSQLVTASTINVPYFYNAFFDPNQDRWLYTNHRGFPIYLNL